jgi:hypothetical protein
MIRTTHLRRVLLVSLMAAGLALAPPAEARAAAPVRSGGSSVTARWTEHGNRFIVVWRWLSNVWGKEGSSMDPFGHH